MSACTFLSPISNSTSLERVRRIKAAVVQHPRWHFSLSGHRRTDCLRCGNMPRLSLCPCRRYRTSGRPRLCAAEAAPAIRCPQDMNERVHHSAPAALTLVQPFIGLGVPARSHLPRRQGMDLLDLHCILCHCSLAFTECTNLRAPPRGGEVGRPRQ